MTLKNIETARKWFCRFFDPSMNVLAITETDAEEFKAWLHEQPKNNQAETLSPSSVAGYIARTKAVFNFGRKKRLFATNPFEFVKKGNYRNQARQFFVPLEWFPNLLEACPNQEWRVLVALARIGGLRIPSEAFCLKWSDVNWERARFYITSPKTRRYVGHEGRMSPLWPELRDELDQLYFREEPTGSDFILAGLRARCSAMNVRTTFEKIIKRAGYAPWPKLFNNMRATRDTELKRAGFTEDQRSAWLGHCESISKSHYQIMGELVTDADFDRAATLRTPPQMGSFFKEESFNPVKSEV